MVEQLIRNQQVVGSSPIFSSKVIAARFAIAYLAVIFYIFSYLMVKNVIFYHLKYTRIYKLCQEKVEIVESAFIFDS